MTAPSEPVRTADEETMQALVHVLREAYETPGVRGSFGAAFLMQARTVIASEPWQRLVRERDEARAEVERTAESLGGMVEWLAEVIVDARDACHRAEQIEPIGPPEWVESGIAMRTTVLREVRAVLNRERNSDPSRLDAMKAERDEARAAVARVEALANHLASLAPADDWGDDMVSTVQADLGRTVLAALRGDAEEASDGQPDVCGLACEHCQPDAFHPCVLPEGHAGYHTCEAP